jgi:serine protease Do
MIGATLLSACAPRFPHPGQPIATLAGAPSVMALAPAAPGSPKRPDLPDFSALAASCGPAVVNVTVLKLGGHADDEQNALEELMRRFGLRDPDAAPARGQGAGFIVSEDGRVLTSAHVVRGAALVTVRLTDRREFSARVIGADPMSDIAVLKIDATGLPVVRFGDPSRVAPGQWVVAIGSPFGFENSVTAGVISGVARSLPDSDYSSFIQTDVALNPGNSGGPLFNLEGEVIGISSQIISRSGGYMGMSFATPIDVVRDIEKQLLTSGRVVRGRIGVTTQEMTAPLAESFGLDHARGGLVSAVEKGAPADKHGIQVGDVILDIDGVRIEHTGQVSRLIAALRPGAAAHLTVWRNRSSRAITVVVDEMTEAAAAGKQPVGKQDEAIASVGLSVRALTPEEREALQTRAGLLVTSSSGPSELAGIEAGDVVLAVNGTSVATTRELQAALAGTGKVVALLIERDQEKIFVPVPYRVTD